MLILLNCTSEDAFEILDRSRQLIASEQLAQKGLDWPMTMSFGAATIIPNLETAPALAIKAADVALYEAKNGGRNRVITSKIT